MNRSRISNFSPVAVLGLAISVSTAFAFPAFAWAYHPSGQEQQALTKLATDLQTIRSGSEVTTAEKQALVADFELLVTSTTKPSPASVEAFTDDLAVALADGNISTVEKAALVLDVDAIFNSAGLSTAQAEEFIVDAKAILVSSGVDAADVQLIETDLAAVAAGVQVNFLVTSASFPLIASMTGSAGSGLVQLTSSTKNDGTTTATLSLETLGLTTGTYTVSATAASTGSAVTLGTLKVLGIRNAPGAGAAVFGDGSKTPFPSDFDPADLVTVTISDSTAATRLTGTVTAATKLVHLGNFRLMPGTAAPLATGNVAFEVTTKASKVKNHFLLYATKLPPAQP